MRFLCLLITIILLTACSSKHPANQYTANDFSVSELPPQTELPLLPESDEAVPVLRLGSDTITDVIFDSVPELNDIAAFIYRKSKGKAHLVVQALDEPINIWETRMSSKYIPYMEHELYNCTFYLAYVGEEWDDGSRIIWYWFYPYKDSNNEFSKNILVDALYYGDYKYYLDEWRNDDFYLWQMNLIQDALSDEENGDSKLDSWIGCYAFSEDENSEQKTNYIVTIYKIIDKFYAKIEINESQIGIILFAKVQGNDNRIDFIYHDVYYNRFDYFTESFNQGDILLSLSRNESELQTHWETLRPPSDESDAVCFYRDDNIKRTIIYNYEHRINFIETDEPDIHEVIGAYNEFLNGRSFILDDVDIMLINNIMGVSDEYDNSKYTLYDMNGDSVPELILQGRRLYILSYDDGKLSVWYTDEHYGSRSYFVNDGNLYYRHGGIANRLMHAYDELVGNGDTIRHFNVNLYAAYDYDSETWVETYTFSKDGDELNITKEKYDELVLIMSNDNQIEWREYNDPESTLRFVQ